MTALCIYALLAKVFPSTLASANDYGRLLAPFGYWNAIGVAAALGLAPALWGATRPSGPTALRALTIPAMTLMMTVIALSYSRSAALVGVLAIAAWVAVVPLRLRSALMLALAGVCTVPLVVVALNDRNLTVDHVPLPAQDTAGHAFGPVLLGIVLVAVMLGVAASLAMTRVTVREPIRRRLGTVLLALVALVPVAGVAALAASSRGLFGQISHAWQSLVSTHSVVHDTAGRLAQLGSSRPAYWHQALDVGSHALFKGVGELGYGIARLHYTTSIEKADQAHSYLFQTFADLGLIGVVLTLALLAAWCRSAARPLAIGTRWRSLSSEQASERRGLVVLAIVVVVFGVQSCLDFTFYFPGVTIPVLVCAGWLAGRGPLTAPVGRRAAPRVSVLERPGAGALVTGLVAVALIGAWVMWQPLRSAQAMTAAENQPATAFASASRSGEPGPPVDRAALPAVHALPGRQQSPRGAGGAGEGHPAAARESSTVAVAGAARPRHRAPRGRDHRDDPGLRAQPAGRHDQAHGQRGHRQGPGAARRAGGPGQEASAAPGSSSASGSATEA